MKTLSKLPTLPAEKNPKEIAKLDTLELVNRVKGRTCWTTIDGRSTKAKIEGGILNPTDHMFIFKAFHIKLRDGNELTVPACKVTIASE